MNINALIEKHVKNWSLYPPEPLTKLCQEFGTELLEMVKKESKRKDLFCGIVIDRALEELRK